MTYTRVIRFPEPLRVAEGEIPRLGLPLAPGGTATDPEGPAAGRRRSSPGAVCP